MHKLSAVALLIAAQLAATVTVQAQAPENPAFFSGNSLMTALESRGGDRREAEGYILGVFDLLAYDKAICPSPKITNQQVLALVRSRIQDSPQYWDAPAAQVVSAFLFSTWRCPGGA